LCNVWFEEIKDLMHFLIVVYQFLLISFIATKWKPPLSMGPLYNNFNSIDANLQLIFLKYILLSVAIFSVMICNEHPHPWLFTCQIKGFGPIDYKGRG